MLNECVCILISASFAFDKSVSEIVKFLLVFETQMYWRSTNLAGIKPAKILFCIASLQCCYIVLFVLIKSLFFIVCKECEKWYIFSVLQYFVHVNEFYYFFSDLSKKD